MGYNYNDYDDCCKAVKDNGKNLYFVPDRLKIGSLCIDAVKQNALAIRYIPENIITYEMCLEAVKQNPSIIMYIPEKHKVKRICKEAVSRNGLLIKYVPEKMQTDDICIIAVTQNPKSLSYIKNTNIDIAIEAMKQYGVAMKYIKKDKEMYIISLNKDDIYFETSFVFTDFRWIESRNQVIISIQKNLIIKELCIRAINNKPHSLMNVPYKFIQELCL
jgi:hypothetical protein